MDMARQSDPSPVPATDVPVLLTRPEAEARTFALALESRFGAAVRPVVAPLMAPRFLAPDLPEGDFDAVVFTSAQGVKAARHLRLALPHQAFCVGRKTALAAEAAGFQAMSSERDADALVRMILAARPGERILYLRGVDTRGEVAERLNAAGVNTESAVVYRQEPQALGLAGTALLQRPGPVIVPLFSSRSAELFRRAVPPEARASLFLAAMSQAVADSLGNLPRVALKIAPRPNAENMLDAVGNLLDLVPPP